MRNYTKKVTFKLTPEELQMLDELVSVGEYRISVGQLIRKLIRSEHRSRHAAVAVRRSALS